MDKGRHINLLKFMKIMVNVLNTIGLKAKCGYKNI